MVWNPFKAFGVWTTLLSWHEPQGYRVRLRGDVLVRVAVALSVGAVFSAGVVALLAINVDPPTAGEAVAWVLGSMCTVGGLVFFVLFDGGRNKSGSVRVCEEGVVRVKFHHASFLGLRNVEQMCWDYSSVSQATIVPGAAIGKSFSLLFLSTPAQWELFGVPRRIAPEQLAATLAARGVNVQFADHIPPSLRQPMNWAVAIVSLGIAAPLVLAGFMFYVVRVPAAGGNVAAAIRRHPMPRPAIPKLPRGPMVGPRVGRAQPQDAAPANNAPAQGAAEPRANDVGGAQANVGPGGAGFPELPSGGAGQGGFRGGGGPPGFRGRAGFGGGPPRVGGPVGFGGPPGMRGARGKQQVEGGAALPIPPPETDGKPAMAAPDVAGAAPRTAPQPRQDKPTKPEYVPPRNQPGEPTELAGGPEGWQFQMVDKGRRTVVGFRYRMGSWGQQAAVAQLDPVYDRNPPPGRGDVLIAREGYVVGGLQVVAGDLVNAVRVIFIREESDGSLNKGDHYFSDWIGDPADQTPKVLGDGRRRVIGICGRNGAVKNALALVLDEP
jgi:hypothetical protein